MDACVPLKCLLLLLAGIDGDSGDAWEFSFLLASIKHLPRPVLGEVIGVLPRVKDGLLAATMINVLFWT